MNDSREREHLAQANRHIAEAKAHIARQKETIDALERGGHDTDVAVSMLKALAHSLLLQPFCSVPSSYGQLGSKAVAAGS